MLIKRKTDAVAKTEIPRPTAALLLRLLLPALSMLGASAAIVDGIVATVGRTVITDSMVRRSLRATAMMGNVPLQENEAAWEASRNRLIEQALVKEEIRISRYSLAQPDEVRMAMEQLRTQFGGVEAYSARLREYRLTDADVAENLTWQITFARFISYRFRPAVQVSDEALRNYYAKWKPAGVKPPFDEVRDLLETEFIAEESSRYMDRWLREARQVTRIETLQPKGALP